MSHYWANHPELYDEITINNLPEPYFSRVKSGKANLEDVPDDVVAKAASEGERNYWGSGGEI